MLTMKQEYIKIDIEELNKKNEKIQINNLEKKDKNLGYKLIKVAA